MEFSVGRYSEAELTAACHWSEATPDGVLHVCCDAFQRGLGTGSCGPDTLEQYRIAPGRRGLELLLVPLAPGDSAPRKAGETLGFKAAGER